MKILIILILFCITICATKEFYFITVPSKLIVDSQHEFQVHTSIDIKLAVETVHISSNIIHKSPIFVIRKGHEAIRYHVPFIGKYVGNNIILNFRGDICKDIKTCKLSKTVYGNFFKETHTIELINNNFIILSETDKPIYKPGEKVKLRFMPIYSTNLKREPEPIGKQWNIVLNSQNKIQLEEVHDRETYRVFDIIIENPDRVRVAQWKNLRPDNAMNLEYQLIKDPVLGEYECKVLFNNQRETIKFEVKKFVLPIFIVNIIPPSEILFHGKQISFQICAKYSTGKLMNADIEGSFSVKTNSYFSKSGNTTFKSTLLKQECSIISIESESVFVKHERYSTYTIKVTVTERGTTSQVSKSVKDRTIHYTPYNIQLKSKKYFKPGLPYFGQLLLTRHNNMPKVNETISISINEGIYENKWGFQRNYKSNDNGIIEFTIPYIPFGKPVFIQVNALGKLEYPLYYSNLYEMISNWESVDGHYLQIQPITTTINCPGSINLTILTNYDVSTIDMHVQIFSRGLISKMITFPPIPIKCYSRDDFLGHYKCTDNGRIVCLTGWMGDNCREPVCKDGCMKGACIEPGRCICQEGWEGIRCDKCKVPSFCKHGFCINGNDCNCLPGWRYYDCSVRVPIIHKYINLDYSKKFTASKLENSKKYEKQTIFERLINIPLLKDMGPDLHIIVYFMNPNIEVVADAIEVLDGLHNCSQLGGGKFKFNKDASSPGSDIVLTMDSGMQNSSCAVRITDTALSQFGTSSNADLSYLVTSLININHIITDNDQETANDKPRCISHYRSAEYQWLVSDQGFDTKKILSMSGFTAITNTRLINRVCNYYRSMIYESTFDGESVVFPDSVQSMPQSEIRPRDLKKSIKAKQNINQVPIKKKKIFLQKQIREYFPESWLFSHFNKTIKNLNLKVPDSMTTWRAESYCMTERGIWMPPPQTLKVILPFHSNIYVPYSIKLGEELHLPVTLFNYADACYEIDARIIVNAAEIIVIGIKSFTLCVCSNDEKTIYFNIKPRVIGRLNITVKAASKYSSFCSDKIQKITDIAMTDAIRRQLFVEPPGIPSETTFSDLICNKNEQLGVVELFHLPEKIVTGSLRSYLKFNGDAMGQTFDNLDKLVRMPYGCGEQNMITMVPSIYVLQYLNGLKIDNPQLHQRARTYIIEGYNRQMKYKHDDGSYSAFGKTDKAGSTWLTAFVLRSFSEASKYVKLEKNVLTEAIKYLGKMQSKSGCFKENGKLFSSTMAGGVKKNDNTDESLLTSYVLLSVMNIRSKKDFLDIDKGLSCVQNGLSSKSSNYQLALTAYVFSVYQANSKLSNSLMKQLIKRVEISGRYQYWPFDRDANENSNINSADIETTGYAFLALNSYQPVSELLKTIYWLSNQRNSLGGYYSTQDTVVALNALAVFAESIGMSKLVHLNVSVVLNGIKTYTDLITEENRLVSRSISLGTENISYISIKTNGSGCLSIQLISLYNIDKSYTAADTFKISVKTKVPSKNECKIRKIHVCFAYLRRDKDSNMILVTINYPSGWQLPKDGMKEFTDQIATPLKRIDFHNTKMELYYDAFSYNDAEKEVCFKFQLEEKSKVSNLKPAFVRIMDYYSPEIYSDAFYDILQETCNKTNETTIPDNPKVLLCPTCVEHSKDSTLKFLKMICQSWLSGLVIANNSGAKNRVFYQAQYSIFYEWTLDLEPTNCTCLKTWPHLNTNFVILSIYWKHLGEKLVLSNDSVMFPLDTLLAAYRFDLSSQCWQANNLYQMMSRLNSSFVSQLKQIGSCAKCVLGSNLNFNIANITSWICANYTSWNFEITQISHRIEGVLSNNSSTRIFVDAEFPDKLCYCRHQMKDLKRSFRILDLKNSIKSINNDSKSPLRLLLDNRFEIVERHLFDNNQDIRCHK